MGKARRRLALLMALTMSVSNVTASSFTAFGAEYVTEETLWEEDVLPEEPEDMIVFAEEDKAEGEVSDTLVQAEDTELLDVFDELGVEEDTESDLFDGMLLDEEAAAELFIEEEEAVTEVFVEEDDAEAGDADSIELSTENQEVNLAGMLCEGSNDITAGENDYNWYAFTPETTGTYYFGNANGLSIVDSDGSDVSDDKIYHKYMLEAGRQYRVGLLGQQWDNDSYSFSYSYAVTIKYAPNISQIVLQDSYRFAEDSFAGIMNMLHSVTVYYQNTDNSGLVDLSARGAYDEYYGCSDEFANSIYFRLLDEGGNAFSTSNSSESIVVSGSYTLEFATDQEFTEHAVQAPVTVMALEEVETVQLTEGLQAVSSDSNHPIYYTFSADDAGEYSLNSQYVENQSLSWNVIYKDAEGIHPCGNLTEISYDPAKQYYIVFTIHDSAYNVVDGMADIIFHKVPQIKTLTVKAFTDDLYADGTSLQDFLGNLRFSYIMDNGREDQTYYASNWYLEYNGTADKYRLSFWLDENRIYGDITKDGELVEISDDNALSNEVETGAYTLSLSNKRGEELTSISFTIKEFDVNSFSQLQTGKTNINNAVSAGRRYYRFTPDRDGKYRFTINHGNASVLLYDQDGEELEADRYSWDDWEYELNAGQTYRVEVSIEYAYESTMRLDIERIPQLTDFTVSSDLDGKTYVGEVESSDAQYELKLFYDNGTTDVKYFWWDTSDEYGNRFNTVIYREGELVSDLDSLPGSYQLYIETSGERKLAAAYTINSYESAAKPMEINSSLQFNDVEGQVLVTFTTTEKGSYRIVVDAAAENLYLYNAEGREIDWSNDNRSVTGDLEAETQYFVRIRLASIFDTANVTVEKLPSAAGIVVEVLEDTLIAGLDSIKDFLEAHVSYGDETRSHLVDDENDAYNGNVWFYTKDSDGEKISIPDKAGEYTVYAGYSPAVSGSSVSFSGSAIRNEDDLESADTVQVKLTLPKAEELEQLTLDTAVKVPGGVTRRLYGFTAPEDGRYTTAMSTGKAESSFYRSDGERLVELGQTAELVSGESVILVVNTAVEGSLRIVKAEDETEPETEPEFEVTVPDRFDGEGSYAFNIGRESKYVLFIPETSGYYEFSLRTVEGWGYYYLADEEKEWMADSTAEIDDIRRAAMYLEEGRMYYLFFDFDTDSSVVMDIACLGKELPKVTDVELIERNDQFVLLNDSWRFSDDLYLKVIFDNQETSIVGICQEDLDFGYTAYMRYGYRIHCGLTLTSDTDAEHVYTASVTAKDSSGQTMLEKALELRVPKPAGLTALSVGENNITYSTDSLIGNHNRNYVFTPETSGYYLFEGTASDEVSLFITGIWDTRENHVYSKNYELNSAYSFGGVLQGGKPYVIYTYAHSDDQSVHTGTGVIRITKGNAVKAMSVVKQPDQTAVLPGANTADLDGLEVAVTYADGSEAVYTYGTGEWYEHLYTDDLIWLSDTRAKVMIHAGYRSIPIYLKGDASLMDTLPAINTDTATEIRHMAVFKPEITGTYTVTGWNTIMEYGMKVGFYQVLSATGRNIPFGSVEDIDDANVDHVVRYYYLTAGQTYLFEKTFGGSIVLTVSIINSDVQDKLAEAEETIKQVTEGTASVEEALEALLGGDDTEGLSSHDIANAPGGVELVQNLEKVIVSQGITVPSSDESGESKTFAIEEPTAQTISGDAEISEDTAEVKGAAVTVAKILSERSDLDEGTYSAQLEVTGQGEQDASADSADRIYQMDISLYITKKSENGAVEKIDDEPQQLKAPIEITIPIPEEYQYYEELKLYHVTESGEEEVPATVNGTTMTFTASSLSPYVIKATHCTHNWTVKENVPATCTQEGHVTKECSACGDTSEETVPKTGHSAEVIPGRAATCAEAGLTDGEKCTVCGEVLKEQTEIKAKGHTYSAWTTTKEADVFEAEIQSRTCSVCGHKETRRSGSKVTPTITTNASGDRITLKTSQKTTGLKITGLAAGDSVSSITIDNKKAVTLSKVNTKAGTCTLKAKKLTGKKGKAVLTITLKSGLKKKINITVQKGTVKTKSISVDKKKITLKKGKSYTLKPVVTPFTSTEKLSYSVKSAKIASVSGKGVIKAKSKGTTKVTIKSGKKKKVITVIVK